MNDLVETLQNLRKVFDLEKAKGYKDSAVLGGLETFINARCARGKLGSSVKFSPLISNMRKLVSDYSKKPLGKRREVISELLDIIRQMEVKAGDQYKENRAKNQLKKPIRYAKGVGGERVPLLNRLGIKILEDLIFYFPHRVEDRRSVKKVTQLKDGERVTIKGRVRFVNTIKPRKDLEIVKVGVDDGSGIAYGVWFNQPWIKNQLSPGEKVAIFGEVERGYEQIQLKNPVWEPIDQALHTSRLVPIYRTTEGLSTSLLRRIIWDNLKLYSDLLDEVLPQKIREKHGLFTKERSVNGLHFPETYSHYEQSRASLAFEELFIFQMGALHEKKRRLTEIQGRKLKAEDQAIYRFLDTYPFQLTEAQKRAIDEITHDMSKPKPMRRLLQGDVGAGKTVIAALSCLICCESGYQAAIMAPTEILAEQHYWNLKPKMHGLKVKLLTGSHPQPERDKLREKVSQGEVDLLIGTHSLIQEEVEFHHLGLVVIDEQQRFGVAQRWELERKGENVDLLVMSATPIPRTITLTIYGQFDFTVVDELPFPKRVKTYWVSNDKREQVYQFVLNRIKEGHQAYVVFPLVEESEELDLKAAVQQKEEFEQDVFKNCKVGLLHGQMPNQQKQQVMTDLRCGEIDVLVSTTVIEVGIHVPNASLLVIEHADRFGLSQLHQLRGRIGREGQESYCFTIATPNTEQAKKRLAVFRDISDGFKIAEEDLKIRGPGELLGVAQHGIDTTFKAADLIKDLNLMRKARNEANKLLEDKDAGKMARSVLREFKNRYGQRFKWARV